MKDGLTQNNKNTVVAVTGGIGSGKSTAVKILNKLGYKSFSADLIYKELLEDECFAVAVSALMGINLLNENGKKTLDRKAVSEIVFNDKEKLKRLNGFTHPLIMKTMLEKARAYNEIVFCEVPLLFEGGFENLFDYVIVVSRNDDLRFEGAALRDGKSVENIKSIAKTQFDYTKTIQNEHTFIIENNGNVDTLEDNIKFALQKIKN